MKFKEDKQDKFESFRIRNSDPYGSAVITYCERWADLMETRLAAGSTVAQCAKETSSEADTDGLTGFQYGCAVMALADFWAHGEELRQWHNLDCQIGTEGEEANTKPGVVLNPEILNIKRSE